MPPRQAIGSAERAMIEEVLDYYQARQLDPGYQDVFEERYCQAFAEWMGGGYADAVATGTAALYVAIAALNLPKGSEVAVSPITDPGTISAIILNGLKPRLVDAMPDSFNTSAQQIAERLSPETSAILIVHAAGEAVDLDPVMALARERGLRVIEDCSQSHGATYRGRKVGSFGDIAAFSTMYRKASITGSCGGVVYTQNEDFYHCALAHADRGKPRWLKGFDDRDPGQFLFPALNLHTDELSCGIGLASLARLEETRAKRLAFAHEVTRLIQASSTACRPSGVAAGSSPFIYLVFVDESKIKVDKQAFAEAVRSEGIGLNPHYRYLVADWPWVQPYLADRFDCPNARLARNSSFALYLNENYAIREAEDAAAAIAKVEAALCR
jgi:dTDP-4-amino-4,6-dideoxygalactose transaminase